MKGFLALFIFVIMTLSSFAEGRTSYPPSGSVPELHESQQLEPNRESVEEERSESQGMFKNISNGSNWYIRLLSNVQKRLHDINLHVLRNMM